MPCSRRELLLLPPARCWCCCCLPAPVPAAFSQTIARGSHGSVAHPQACTLTPVITLPRPPAPRPCRWFGEPAQLRQLLPLEAKLTGGSGQEVAAELEATREGSFLCTYTGGYGRGSASLHPWCAGHNPTSDAIMANWLAAVFWVFKKSRAAVARLQAWSGLQA